LCPRCKGLVDAEVIRRGAVGRLRLENLGVSPDLLERARTIAAILIDEVRKGALGYVLITAEKI
jgi:hypothetical protein